MNKEAIIALSAATGEAVKYAQNISDKIVSAQASELDNLILEIKTNIIDAPNLDDTEIERAMLKLGYVLCAINPQVDRFSFYDAISASNETMAYNEKYAESQMNATAEGKKLTKDDYMHYAENATVNDKLLNLIYNKSVRILKDKVDSGYEMLDVLKRILKHHEQENYHDKQNRTLLE